MRVWQLTPLAALIFAAGVQPTPAPPTFNKDVAPILYAKCAGCHHEGEVAPFSLLSFEDARKRASLIATVVSKGYMPPWKATHGYNEFLDENRLSEQQITVLKEWAQANAPRGSGAAPKPPTFSSAWTLGQPDVVIKPQKSYKLAAEGNDVYRNFVIETHYGEAKWIRAMDVHPGNKRVVHHVIAFLDENGKAKKLEEQTKDGQPGYETFGGVGFMPSGSLGGWAPGVRARFTPDDTAFKLAPGTTLVLQVHYHKSGKEELDQTQVALYFSKAPPKREMHLAWILNPGFRLKAGDSNSRVQMSWPVSTDVTAYAAMPHMHLLGKTMKAWIETPASEQVPLVEVKDWDFNWQLIYAFQRPLKIPARSKIRVEASYDNSDTNPNNPNKPPRDVFWGEQTTDEMFLLIVPYTVDALTSTAGK